jgi:SAM-dependent methyltransferase
VNPDRQSTSHQARILDQFTRQAVPFSEAPSMRDEQALALLADAAELQPGDTTLDVACGPGLLVRHFAPRVRQAVGVDLTPAMLARARQLCAEAGRTNVRFETGDANALPFADASFDVVTSRFAFHHFESPRQVLAEIVRVCRPGGRIVVCDAVCPPDAAGAELFNRLERLRDPSTTRFLPEAELLDLFADAGLAARPTRYRVPLELEAQMRASFPREGDGDVVRALLREQLEADAMRIRPRLHEGRLLFSYPAVVLAAVLRPAPSGSCGASGPGRA